MVDPLYATAIEDADRVAMEELKERVRSGNASSEDLARLVGYLDTLQRENDDLSVLYSTTVGHATAIENELLQKNLEVGEFLASMSHELRTPLNAILGYAELVRDTAEDEGLDELLPDLSRIAKSGGYLLTLINDVLDLSKIEAGRLQLRVDLIDVPSTVEEVAGTLKSLAIRRRNTLRVACDREGGRVMTTDETRLRQILINLVGNALKFTENGTVELRARGSDGRWVFEVTDTGIGMTEAQMEGLFRPFSQASAEISHKYGGTGLGLALSQRLAVALGGEVRVASVPGEGSTFSLSLPAG